MRTHRDLRLFRPVKVLPPLDGYCASSCAIRIDLCCRLVDAARGNEVGELDGAVAKRIVRKQTSSCKRAAPGVKVKATIKKRGGSKRQKAKGITVTGSTHPTSRLS